MRVKVGQLKARLSEYLRQVEATGEPVEVCVRETPVAWLTPIQKGSEARTGGDTVEVERLRTMGLSVRTSKVPKGNWKPTVGRPGDGRRVENTVVEMRESKDW
ncbi:MAG: type II toxin-antitoxin system Phd/YefM family antitoxin [Oceanipulchritudo sp.]|jgi:prevent-host-death family protein